MRYLRLLSNSMAAALLGAGYVFAVVLQLNPTLSLDPLLVAPIALTVVLFYAAQLTALFYAYLVLVNSSRANRSRLRGSASQRSRGLVRQLLRVARC